MSNRQTFDGVIEGYCIYVERAQPIRVTFEIKFPDITEAEAFRDWVLSSVRLLSPPPPKPVINIQY